MKKTKRRGDKRRTQPDDARRERLGCIFRGESRCTECGAIATTLTRDVAEVVLSDNKTVDMELLCGVAVCDHHVGPTRCYRLNGDVEVCGKVVGHHPPYSRYHEFRKGLEAGLETAQ